MKYLKSFRLLTEARSYKEYFKDRIDWKLITLLEDLLTEYQDMGYDSSVTFCIKDPSHYPIYNSVEGWSQYQISDETIKELKKYGLVYTVSLYELKDIGPESKEYKDEWRKIPPRPVSDFITCEKYVNILNKILEYVKSKVDIIVEDDAQPYVRPEGGDLFAGSSFTIRLKKDKPQ